MTWLGDEPALLVSYCSTPRGWPNLTNARRGRQSGWQGTRRISRGDLGILLVPQTAAAATSRVLWALVCLLFYLCGIIIYFFSLVLCLTLFTSSGVFVIFYVFPARSFSGFGHLACGGGHDRLFSLVFAFVFLFFSFDLSTLFLLDCFFSLIYFLDCVCRACRI